jgi:cellulose binding protein with CBM2 domain/fibronectin type III domain protein
MNVGVGQNTQPGALFLADAYSELLENEVFTVQWWNVHNGIDTVSTVAGQTDYRDFGLLSSGNCLADGTTCEPALNTPFAPYHALRLMSSFVHPGDQLIRAGTDNPMVAAHAARRPNGDVAVLLVNRDPDQEQTVDLDYRGFRPDPARPPTFTTYRNGAAAADTTEGGSATVRTLAPYSLAVLTLHSAATGGAVPGAPGRPVATAVTDRSATISWPAAAAGARGIAKYEVYRDNGAISEQLGETSATSFTVHNLTPGTRYTVTVLSRDAGGRASWSSLPLTFTTGSPATSSCTVRLTDTSDWGNGFVGAVDITNNGPAPLTGWTLTFSWPTGWQKVDSGWSGTWTQTARDVRVTSTEQNAALAVGGTTSAGFVGSYSGPNVLPAVFALNGTVCHTG